MKSVLKEIVRSTFVKNLLKWSEKSVNLKIQTLYNYIKGTGIKPNLLKIDTDGFQLDVRKNFSTCISKQKTFIIKANPLTKRFIESKN